METLGVIGHSLFKDPAHHIVAATDEPLAHKFLLQYIAVPVQREHSLFSWDTCERKCL